MCGDKGEEHMKKHGSNNTTDRGIQRGEHRRQETQWGIENQNKDTRHDTKSWKSKYMKTQGTEPKSEYNQKTRNYSLDSTPPPLKGQLPDAPKDYIKPQRPNEARRVEGDREEGHKSK